MPYQDFVKASPRLAAWRARGADVNHVICNGMLHKSGGGCDNPKGLWAPFEAHVSPVREVLDQTIDVLPDAVRSTKWYYEQWPYLYEEAKTVNGVGVYTQRCWPISDTKTRLFWDAPAADPAKVTPPIWSWPWGRPIITRVHGGPAEGIVERHSLTEFCPDAGMRFLQTLVF